MRSVGRSKSFYLELLPGGDVSVVVRVDIAELTQANGEKL